MDESGVDSSPSYFTCTLSQALEYNMKSGLRTYETPNGVVTEHEFYHDMNSFIDFLADKHGTRLATGCVKPATRKTGQKEVETLDFSQVRSLSYRAGNYFRDQLSGVECTSCWVALLAPSSIRFLISWLGLLRVGFKVLLIAPQSSAKNISLLLEEAEVGAIFHDAKYSDLVEAATSLWPTTSLELTWTSATGGGETASDQSTASAVDEAFAFHSSGTTGLPKLIPQTHHGAVGVLPLLCGSWSSDIAAFTTTPLYHGGIADVLRSWSAAAPIWLFPEGHLPITGRNIAKMFEVIDQYKPKLGYFSSVPFVLEGFRSDRLNFMDAVGVGGAAMPQMLGDRLVADGVHLVSRFGSSECGFLLSSDRNFNADKGWNLFRGSMRLEFKPSDEGLSELIVPSTWPLVSTAKHASRPFGTKDIFEQTLGGLIYKGRSDAQLTLVTGKKFDPESTENLLRCHFQDAIVVGDNMPVPGALVFSELKHEEINLDRILIQVNGKLEKHARLAKENVVALGLVEAEKIKRNSKGGIIRNAVYTGFSSHIKKIYEDNVAIDSRLDKQTVTEKISAAFNHLHLTPHDDFFEAGLESIEGLVICRRLQESLGVRVHISDLYECGNIMELTKKLTQNGHRSKTDEQTAQEMRDMVKKYTDGQPEQLKELMKKPRDPPATGKTVLLTGATGFLGIYILDKLLRDPEVQLVIAFVRGSHITGKKEQRDEGRARIKKALKNHQLSTEQIESKLSVTPFFADATDLGLETIPGSIDEIIHAAWDVDFLKPVKSFDCHIRTTVQLWNLTQLLGAKFEFKSSVAAGESGPSGKGRTGYGQSKWVAEQVLKGVKITRVGQLSAASETGIWNRREAWPMMFEASWKAIGGLPELKGDEEWQPVDTQSSFIFNWAEVIAYLSRRWNMPVFAVSHWLDELDKTEHRARILSDIWRKNWNKGDKSAEMRGVDEEYWDKLIAWLLTDD